MRGIFCITVVGINRENELTIPRSKDFQLNAVGRAFGVGEW